MFAWCFHRIAAASSGITTTAAWKDPARCRIWSNDFAMSSLLREHARRRARTGQLMIAMMQLSAEIALRRFIAASALLGSLSIGTGALAQEIKLTRSAASGI